MGLQTGIDLNQPEDATTTSLDCLGDGFFGKGHGTGVRRLSANTRNCKEFVSIVPHLCKPSKLGRVVLFDYPQIHLNPGASLLGNSTTIIQVYPVRLFLAVGGPLEDQFPVPQQRGSEGNYHPKTCPFSVDRLCSRDPLSGAILVGVRMISIQKHDMPISICMICPFTIITKDTPFQSPKEDLPIPSRWFICFPDVLWRPSPHSSESERWLELGLAHRSGAFTPFRQAEICPVSKRKSHGMLG